MIGLAIKLTLEPEQMAPVGEAAIVTDGVTSGLTVIVMVFEVPVELVTQATLLVNMQFTVALLANELEV